MRPLFLLVMLAASPAGAVKLQAGSVQDGVAGSSIAPASLSASTIVANSITANNVSSSPVLNVSSISSPGTLGVYTNGGDQVARFTTVGMLGSNNLCFGDSTLGTMDLCESSGGDLYLRRYDTSVTAGDTIGSIVFRDRDSSTGGTSDKATYKVTAYGNWGSNEPMEVAHQFQLKRPGASLADYMVISTTGTLITGYPGFTADSTVACGTCTLQVVSPSGSGASIAGNLDVQNGTFTVTGGMFTAPAQQFTSLYSPLGTFTDNVEATVHWAEVSTNTGNGFVITSSDTITAKAAGLYLCDALLGTDVATVQLSPRLYHNDAKVAQKTCDPVTSANSGCDAVKQIQMAAGDTVKVKVLMNNAGTGTLNTGQFDSYFQCSKIR